MIECQSSALLNARTKETPLYLWLVNPFMVSLFEIYAPITVFQINCMTMVLGLYYQNTHVYPDDFSVYN